MLKNMTPSKLLLLLLGSVIALMLIQSYGKAPDGEVPDVGSWIETIKSFLVELPISFNWLEEIPLWLKVVGVCLVLAFLLSIWSGDGSTMWLIFIGSFVFVIVATLATNVWEWLQGLGL